MNDLESLMEARDAYKRYATTMRRLFSIMTLCWISEVPLIIYAPTMLVIVTPAAVAAGIIAWWTYFDAHHDHSQYRLPIPGPRAALAAAEANYRRTL